MQRYLEMMETEIPRIDRYRIDWDWLGGLIRTRGAPPTSGGRRGRGLSVGWQQAVYGLPISQRYRLPPTTRSNAFEWAALVLRGAPASKIPDCQ
jgi:hypothetical protein